MDRNASAVWHGSLKEGKGTISTQSGTLKDTQYSFKTRFADGVGTNPEELIAAAHAGCFTMAFSAQLTEDVWSTALRKTFVVILHLRESFARPHSSLLPRGPEHRPVVEIEDRERPAPAGGEGCMMSRPARFL